MLTNKSNLKKSLNKAYYKQSIKRSEIELFKVNLKKLYHRLNEKESEEHLKNIISDLLKETWYNTRFEINTKDRIDLAIYNGKTSKDSVGVIIEVKKPLSPERLTLDSLNCKALHELILYYFDERNENSNIQVKNLIATNVHEWFIFDENEFDKVFYRNVKLQKLYKSKVEQSKDNPFFYKEAQKIIEGIEDEITFTYFSLNDYKNAASINNSKDDAQLIELYKILSPEHLLKLPFTNDSNSLNKEFYHELLHIIGLEEHKEGSKKLINRKPSETQDEGSLLENIINCIVSEGCLDNVPNPEQYGESRDKILESVGLELCITWLNRILFLKLLEGQLINYHKENDSFSFLSSSNIKSFGELNELFFDVLAVKPNERSKSVNQKFGNIPYLNSSLFERSELENNTIRINSLKDRLEMPVYKHTVIKDKGGNRISGNKSTLHYLFDFLDAYDFASESTAKIQEQNKSIINASVLGLIFEKINGYKDGSFFTPGFITMYMCRETIRRAVIQKFNMYYGWGVSEFSDLKDKIEYKDKKQRQEANVIVNSLTICDPAVGSGHFLVSALNEIIAIKSELGILQYRDGNRLQGYRITIENDELIIIDEENDHIFAYTLNQNHKPIIELQKLQETLFHEKETIIENCMFGVDINPKSIMICRLRLWIELLKNAYYTEQSKYAELETLPNIDINIKCGNSLISRTPVDSKLEHYSKSIQDKILLYKQWVKDYKNTTDKSEKKGISKLIDGVRESFESWLPNPNRKIKESLDKLTNEFISKYNLDKAGQLFSQELTPAQIKDRENLQKDIDKLNVDIEANSKNPIFQNSFEWRFEFPEVLDENGDFVGFDVVIGNPPYIPLEEITNTHKAYYKAKYTQIERKYDTSVLFIIEGLNISNNKGVLAYIAPITWQTGENYQRLRKYLFENKGLFKIVNLPFNIFEDAYVETAIYLLDNKKLDGYHIYNFDKKDSGEQLSNMNFSYIPNDLIDKNSFKIILDSEVNKFLQKFKGVNFTQLGLITKSTQGLSGSAFIPSDVNNENIYPFLNKGNVYNYQLIVEESYNTDLTNHQSLMQFYQAEPKILIRRIINRQDRLSIGYTENRMVFKKDINPFIPIVSEYSAKYLLGLLASRLISFIYLKISTIASKDDFRQTTLTELRNIPIPKLSKPDQEPIVNIVDKILSLKQSNPQADTSELENKVDQLVYKLYGLTKEEIAVIENSEKNNKPA